MSSFAFTALLLLLAAVFGLINHRTLKLPSTIGVLVVALIFSVLVLVIDPWIVAYDLAGDARVVLDQANLSHLLLDSVLAFLLFAGSLHVDLAVLRTQKWPILALASVGTLIATALLALGMWGIFGLVGTPVPFTWCVVLGAIVAPTDPVAVSALLQKVGLPAPLQSVITGESLFNDGIAVVMFLLALGIATGESGELGLTHIGIEFGREVGGGVLLGVLAGYAAYRAIRLVDEYNLELTISLACATGTYTLAQALGVSGPIAVVIAGLLVGNHATEYAMSKMSRERIVTFWALVDEVLNTLLFLLIGLEVLAIERDHPIILAMLCAIPLALLVRLVSVAVPLMVLPARAIRDARVSRIGAIGVLTWGGLRGGISVALALSLPASPYRDGLLTVCYGLVVFTIVVQGLTMPWVVRRLLGAPGRAP
jgi:CPA1 family monovalent cation:H+ antiporter